LKIFVLSGALTDEHDVCIRVPDAEDDVIPPPGELAPRAVPEHGAKLVETGCVADRRL
jgi:hypothetical protein